MAFLVSIGGGTGGRLSLRRDEAATRASCSHDQSGRLTEARATPSERKSWSFLIGSDQLPMTFSLGAMVPRPRNLVACCRLVSICHDARRFERADHHGCVHKSVLDSRPPPDVRASSCGARRGEGFSVRSHEIPHRHRRLAGQFGDELVFTRKEAVLIVDSDRAEVLDHELM
jgi:hypothetical protein